MINGPRIVSLLGTELIEHLEQSGDVAVPVAELARLGEQFVGESGRREQHTFDELRLYTVPRAEEQHPVLLERFDPEKTRIRELITIGDTTLNVLGSPAAFGLVTLTLGELADQAPPATIAATIDRAVEENLTRERMLVEDLLDSLRWPLSVASRDTYPDLRGTPGRASRDTSREEVEKEESFRADARDDEEEPVAGPQTPPAGAEKSSLLRRRRQGPRCPGQPTRSSMRSTTRSSSASSRTT